MSLPINTSISIEISPEIIAAIIAAAATIIVMAFTQHQAKKIAYFQTLFEKKMQIYSGYWAAVAAYESIPTEEHRAELLAKTHEVALFSPDPIYEQALVAANKLDDGKLCGEIIEDLVSAMREDIARCKSMKF